VNKEEQHIAVHLTKKQIEDSPSLDSDKPVSRQFEEAYYGYYGWPWYWGGPYSWGPSPFLVRDHEGWQEVIHGEKTWDPHLRSTHDVTNHRIHAIDGEIGHVEDFIIDDETWAIRYLVVDTRNWWPGKKVLISPRWIERVSWNESKVFVNLSREKIRQSPEYAGGLCQLGNTRPNCIAIIITRRIGLLSPRTWSKFIEANARESLLPCLAYLTGKRGICERPGRKCCVAARSRNSAYSHRR